MGPMERIVEKAIQAKAAWGYFENPLAKRNNWEGRLRSDFREFREALRKEAQAPIVQRYHALLTTLAHHYKIQYFRKEHAPRILALSLEQLHNKGWLEHDPPALFANVPEQVHTLAPIVVCALNDLAAEDIRKEYSLLTKLLYFTYPESFPIYDANVALSIQEWSYFAFRDEDNWKKFSSDKIKDKAGAGYQSIVEFYQLFWQHASAEKRLLLQQVSDELTATVGAPVSKLDLLDKLLWDANGNPVKLGLI